MKLSQVDYVVLGLTILYVAFFTHPPPPFIQSILSTPWGHIACLVGIVFVSMKVSTLAGMFVGIAYLLSCNPTLEYFEEKKDKKEEKEQPKSGAPDVKMELKGMAGKILSQMGKDVKSPPPSTSKPKPAEPTKEEFTPY
jgi:uncharacterized membrane protein YuzA (DUF378 family)